MKTANKNAPKWDQYGNIAYSLFMSGKTLKEIEAILQGAVSETTLGNWSKKHKWVEQREHGKLSLRAVNARLYALIVAKVSRLDDDSPNSETDSIYKLYKMFKEQVKESEEEFKYLALDALEDFFSFCVRKLDVDALQTQRALVDDYISFKIEQNSYE